MGSGTMPILAISRAATDGVFATSVSVHTWAVHKSTGRFRYA